MRKTILLSVMIIAAIVVGCNKKSNEPVSGNTRTKNHTYAAKYVSTEFGTIHNSLLDYYYSQMNANYSSIFPNLTPSNYHSTFRTLLEGYTSDYVANNFESSTSVPSINATMYSTISAGLDSAFTSDVPTMINMIENSSLSSNYKKFFNSFIGIIDNNPVDFNDQITNLQAQYDTILTDSVENISMNAGCEVAISSYSYWNNSTNSSNWANLLRDPHAAHKTTASTGAILGADAIGACVWAYRGAVIGASIGPGGAVAGGVIGVVYGAAMASGTAYVTDKVLGWFGF